MRQTQSSRSLTISTQVLAQTGNPSWEEMRQPPLLLLSYTKQLDSDSGHYFNCLIVFKEFLELNVESRNILGKLDFTSTLQNLVGGPVGEGDIYRLR